MKRNRLTGKKTHNLRVENYVLFGVLTEDCKQGSSLPIALRDCSQEVREEPGNIGVFAQKQTDKQTKKPNTKKM